MKRGFFSYGKEGLEHRQHSKYKKSGRALTYVAIFFISSQCLRALSTGHIQSFAAQGRFFACGLL